MNFEEFSNRNENKYLESHSANGGERRTVDYWSDTWDRNIDLNKRHFKDAYEILDKEKGKTAVLVAAGPSLATSFEHLQALQAKDPNGEKHFVFAVNRAVRPLKKMGIKVHYATMVDGDLPYMEMDSEGTTLLCCGMADPFIIKNWKGDVYCYLVTISSEGVPSPYLEKAGIHVLLQCGGNSSTGLLSATLTILGSKRIIFVGHDFSDPWPSPKCLHQHPSLWGSERPAYTNPSYMLFAYWTLKTCAKNQEECEFINASNGGILGVGQDGTMFPFIRQERIDWPYHRLMGWQIPTEGTDLETYECSAEEAA